MATFSFRISGISRHLLYCRKNLLETTISSPKSRLTQVGSKSFPVEDVKSKSKALHSADVSDVCSGLCLPATVARSASLSVRSDCLVARSQSNCPHGAPKLINGDTQQKLGLSPNVAQKERGLP